MTRLLTARRPATALGVCRIAVGLAALARGLKSGRDLYLLHSDPDVVPARAFDWVPAMDSVWQIALFGGLWVVAAIGLTLGYRARVCAAVVLVAAVAQQAFDQSFRAHHMDFLVVVLLLVAISESDAAVSIRAWRDKSLPRDVTAWPVWLLQVQLSIVYFYTAAAKLNAPFLTGQVLLDRLALPDFARDPAVIAVVATGTVGLEFYLAFALWVPRTRPFALAMGLVFHCVVPLLLGIYAGLVVFSLLVFGIYVLFLDDLTVERGRDSGRRILLRARGMFTQPIGQV